MPSKMYEIAFQLGAKIQSTFGNSFSEVQKRLSSTDKELQRITESSQTANKGLSGLFKGAMQFAGGLAIWDGIKNGVKNTIGAGIEFNSTMEQSQIAFSTLLGSAEKAKDLMGQLTQFAAATPFETADLTKASQTLLAFGINGDKVMPTLKMLGDVSQGNKERFDSLTLAFAQIQSAGKLQGQDLLQLINAGFNPLQVISEKTGKSMAELKDEMSKGAISADMVTQAFRDATSEGGRFNNAMQNQGKSFEGQISTLKDNLNMTFGGVMKPAFDWLSSVALPKAIELTGKFQQGFETGGLKGAISTLFPPSVAVTIDKISGASSNLVNSFSKVTPSIMKIAASIGDAFTKILPTVQKAVTFIVNVVLPPLVKLFNFIATNILPRVASAFATYMPRIAQLINNVWSIISPILHFLIGLITVVGATVGTAALGIINFIANLAKNLFNILDGIIQFIAGVFTGNWSSAWEGVTKIFGGIFGTLGTLAKAPLNAVISLINAAIAGINQIGFTIPDWVPGMGGKQFSVNIPQIPQLAQGGYIKHRTGGILATIGEGSEDEIVSPVSKLKEFINSSSTQVPNITFSPQIIIKGNASQDDVVQALNISKSQFKRFMDDYLAGRQRLSFDQS